MERMNPIGKRSLYVIAALAVIALVVYALMPSPMRVEFAQAARGPLQVTIDEDGEVRAHDRYVVAAPVAGRLARIALLEGDAVKAAQVVARIAPSPMSSRERDEQLARASAADALVREAQERAGHADADYAQARRERQRVESLVQKAFVSPQALEQARVAETTSQNEARAARFRADSAAAEARAVRAGLLALQPDKAGALVEVPAPVAGSVLRVLEKSERVVAAGTPLLVLGDPSRYEVVIDVLSTDAVNVRPGMRMLLTGWGGSKTLEARVRTVEPAAFTKVSALGVEEQRVNVVADFVDPPGPLGDAYRVDGHVVLWEAADALKLPAPAVFRHGDGWAVFVAENGRARLREIRTGQRNAAEVEVLDGIAAGTRVVKHPPNALRDGMAVVDQAK